MKITTRFITITAITAAIYVVLTYLFQPISFSGNELLQFRISEITNLFVFLNPIFAPGVILGCLISNLLLSPFGLIDVIFGTLGTALSVWMITKCKRLIPASICPAIGNIIVGFEIAIFFRPEEISFIKYLFMSTGAVMLGEIVVVTVFGSILFYFLMKNKGFVKFIKNIS